MFKFYKKYPHLASHSEIIISPATLDDYLFEEQFEQFAIIVTVKSTKDFCDQIQCNNHIAYAEDCAPTDEPSVFTSHSQTWGQCQPACFMYGDIERKPGQTDSFFVNWDGNKCVYGAQELFTYFTDPRVRSDKKWTAHLNTIPDGFDIEFRNSRMYAKLNAEYCDEFDLNFNGTNCQAKWWQEFLSFTFIGSTIPTLIESACKQNFDTKPKRKPFVDPNLNSIPVGQLSKDNWLENIDSNYQNVQPNIKLEDLGFNSIMRTHPKRGQFYWSNKGGLQENFLFYQTPNKTPTIKNYETYFHLRDNNLFSSVERKKIFNRETVDYTTRYNYLMRQIHNTISDKNTSIDFKIKMNRQLLQQDQTKEGTDDDNWQNFLNKFDAFFINLADMIPGLLQSLLNDWRTYVGIGYSVIEESLINLLKKLSTDVLEGTLGHVISTGIGDLSERMLSTVIKDVISREISIMIASYVGKIAIMAAKLGLALVDIINILQIITIIFDIAFSFWDPFGLNNKLSADALNSMSDAYYEALKLYGMSDVEITPPMMFQLLMKNDEDKTNNNLNDERIKKPNRFSTIYKNKNLIYKNKKNNQKSFEFTLDYYDLDILFSFEISSLYLATRTANSVGELFNWEEDELVVDEIPKTTIYQSMISNYEVKKLYNSFNFSQCFIVIIYIIIIFLGIILCAVNLKIIWAILITLVGLLINIKFTTNTTMTDYIISNIISTFGETTKI
jgi:hypothetical protein